jgi:O-antigen/teichoic acid export membrane protein
MIIRDPSNATVVCAEEDRTGREGLIRNVLFSWGGQFVFIIAGFIMPRLIDRRLGQEVLGVWDFAWSLVAYFQFIEAGITCSVNRYVGRYWGNSDITSINRVVSCATFILCLAGFLVFTLTMGLVMLLPHLFGARLDRNLVGAQWAVLFLGTSLAIQTALGAFNGVVTGCHRWDLLNINRSGCYLATVIGMIVALRFGGGLLGMAIVTFVGELFAQAGRVILAYRICRGLRVEKSLIQRSTISELYLFGGKILVPNVSNMLLNSVTSTLVVAYLGPAALALFSRPRSLLRQIESLVMRMTMPLIPTTSSLEGIGDTEAIRNLLINSVRYTLYLILPPILVLTIFGGPVMQLWMGPRYASGLLVAVLAIGSLVPIAQASILDVLAGLNAHGRPGIAQFVASLVSILLVYAALGPLHLGVVGVAAAITLPLAIATTVYYLSVVSSQLGIKARDYIWGVSKGPLAHIIPFAVCLVSARLIFLNPPLRGLILGGSVGAIVLGIIYWQRVVPRRLKEWPLRWCEANLGKGRGWLTKCYKFHNHDKPTPADRQSPTRIEFCSDTEHNVREMRTRNEGVVEVLLDNDLVCRKRREHGDFGHGNG